MGRRSPKIPTFSGSAPERLKRGPQYSARWRNFQKSQPTFVVLRIDYNPSTFRHVSRQNPRCLTQKTKKCRFCSFWHRFQPNGCATAVFKMNCSFIGLSSSPIAELKTYVGVFEIFTLGLRYRDDSAGLSRHNQKNRSVLRGRIWELGGKNLPPQNFSAFFGLRIERRL